MAKRKSEHYIDNQQFFSAMLSWKALVNEADKKGEKHPPVTNYIGECFLKIAENLSKKPNFINYPYRDEMICDGIENCLLYAYNFDPNKSTNPFSYFTQIIYFAFLRRIQKEKKQAYIKLKKMEMHMDDPLIRKWFQENYVDMGKPSAGSDGKDHVVDGLSGIDIESFEKKGSGAASKKTSTDKKKKPKPTTTKPKEKKVVTKKPKTKASGSAKKVKK